MVQITHVCYLSYAFHPVLTGPGEWFRRNAEGFRRRNVELEVVTARREGTAYTDIVDGIPIRRFDVAPWGAQGVAELHREAVSYFVTRRMSPDVVQGFQAKPVLVPSFLRLRRMGIPAVYLDTMMPVEQTRKFSQIKRRLSTQVSFSVYDAVVTYSAAMRNALEESGVPRSKIHTIANGLDLSRFCPVRNVDEQSQLRKKLGFGTDDEIVVFAGTIMYRKGVHLLIDAWPHLINARPNVRLVLLGNTTSFNEYVISLQRLVSASPKADRVHFMGIVGNIEDYMRAADLFVLPSYLEGLPHVVIEAMACGLPCLLTPFPGITPELGEAGRHFQLVPYDGEAIAHAAADLLSNRPRASAMGQLAAAQVRPLFNIEDALDAYAELYHRVAHKVK